MKGALPVSIGLLLQCCSVEQVLSLLQDKIHTSFLCSTFGYSIIVLLAAVLSTSFLTSVGVQCVYYTLQD